MTNIIQELFWLPIHVLEIRPGIEPSIQDSWYGWVGQGYKYPRACSSGVVSLDFAKKPQY